MSWKELHKAIQEAYHIEDEATVIKIPFENIVEVNTQALIYKSNDGAIEKIVFDNCVKNFNLALGREITNLSGQVIKAVGGRSFAKPMAFYEFFTDTHHTRFCMNLKQTPIKKFLCKIGWNAYSKEFSVFYALQQKLNAVGYSAIDLR